MSTTRLFAAIARAQADARTLYSSMKGEQEDPRERSWFFPPAAAVHAEVTRLCATHGLAIILTGVDVDREQVLTYWAVLHVDSGETLSMRWVGEPMPDAPTPSHGIAAAVRYAGRAFPLTLFSIPARPNVHDDEGVVDGVIVKLSTEQLAERERVRVQPRPPSPLLPPSEASAARARDLARALARPKPDHDPAELAAEADAAALDVSAVDFHAALQLWGAAEKVAPRERLTSLLRVAHDGDTSVDWSRAALTGSPEALARRGRAVALLRKGGYL